MKTIRITIADWRETRFDVPVVTVMSRISNPQTPRIPSDSGRSDDLPTGSRRVRAARATSRLETLETSAVGANVLLVVPPA